MFLSKDGHYSYVYMYVLAWDRHATIAGCNVYTGHAMGSVDTGLRRSPLKLSHTCDGHGTSPRCSCVNGRGCARNNGIRQRDLFLFKMAFGELFLNVLILPGTKSPSSSSYTCADVFSRALEVGVTMRSHSLILRMGTCLTSLMTGVTTVFNECNKSSTSCANAIACLARNSWHSLGECHTCPVSHVNVAYEFAKVRSCKGHKEITSQKALTKSWTQITQKVHMPLITHGLSVSVV